MKRMFWLMVALGVTLTAGAQTGRAEKPEGTAQAAAVAEDRSAEAAAALALDPKLKTKLEEFFQRLRRLETRLAYAKLLEGSRLGEQREVIERLVTKTDEVLRGYGRIEEVELTAVERGGRTLLEVKYLVSTEQRPLQWSFVCYLGGGKWQLLDLGVSGDLRRMLPSRAESLVDDPE